MIDRAPRRAAAILVLPYFVLGLVWAFANPPGAAPDEIEHLVKALGAARLDVGTKYHGPPIDPGLIGVRNVSLSRDFTVPANLAPDGYSCAKFKPDRTAACLPDKPVRSRRPVVRTSALGSYPMFTYVPIGLAAQLGTTPGGAFHLARLAGLVMSTLLLWAAVWHLMRWLGRAAALGVVVALTPMAVFVAASVTANGLEVMSALALSAVAVVATRRPESLARGWTLALVGVAGSTLVLSRQLGVVTLAVLVVLALARRAGGVVWRELRAGRLAAIAAVASVGASVVAVAVWERAYDHPVYTATPFTGTAMRWFVGLGYHYVQSGVGNFGYQDTALPGVAIGLWVVAATTLCAVALLFGPRADRWSLAALLATTAVVAFLTQSIVFTPVQSGLQGRHLLALFCVVPVLAGVVVVERLQDREPAALRRLFLFVALAMAGLQGLSVLVNSRRYAVGVHGPLMFLGRSEWSPQLGWVPWLVTAVAAAAALAVATMRSVPGVEG